MTKTQMAEQIVATFQPNGVSEHSLVMALVESKKKSEIEEMYRLHGAQMCIRIERRIGCPFNRNDRMAKYLVECAEISARDESIPMMTYEEMIAIF